MNAPNTERTPPVIAAEINAINLESRKMLLKNAIEVGRRLKEAKELLKHGEWLKWLKESVNYSKSTAANLMRLYEEYGYLLLNPSEEDPNFQALGNLTYTQAVLLLGLPEEEREEFVAQNDVANMTSRQLNQAVKEQSEVAPAKAQPQAEPQAQSMPKIPEDIQIQYVSKTINPRRGRSRETAPSPSLIVNYEEKCTACCKTIADTFQELLTALGQLSRLDPQVKEKCSQDAGQLAAYMVERLKDWPPVAGSNMAGIERYSTYEW
ncbi:Protein of unknown function (DUF3102) [Desulfitobacterium dehalogenans ATCC 51507]|uniref:DUF3102 domain-containing protein n=1 Tax=Desulfitobacterium dehalogenans (strain ATCC 51507 / DSM 9161 / JW/IU-DC1) TaxID=756499 RepID=I4A3Q3_DESDJ|nr:Protein of unknown function (DUF3102) [Desulfitobacterium dehalogenans ATCC 51507]